MSASQDVSKAATLACGDAPSRVRPRLERGTCVDRYVLIAVLGEGGMGVVYKAYDPELDRPVALKLVNLEGDAAGPFRDRLLREAKALARLSHPNVISVYDAGTFGDDVFLATEFVEGPTLRHWLAQKTRSQREVVDVFLAAGRGLSAAHRVGLVHRDFKPENVLVGDDGRVRVLDFGLARAAAPMEPSDGETVAVSATRLQTASEQSFSNPLTAAGNVLGTPRYMAPEQHRGEALDERVDQFAFCVSLYEALFRALPFEGRSLEEYRKRVLLGRLADPPAGAKVPRWLRQTLIRGLSTEPAKRYPSMDALIHALDRDRRATRGRDLALVGLAVGLTVAAAAVLQNRSDARAQLCRGGPQRLAGVWDAASKERVRTALAGTGAAFSADTWKNVERAIDRYSQGWLAMHKESCEATQLRGEQSEAVMTLRMACLDLRRQELDALVTVLTQADKGTVERAESASGQLTSLATCADVPALLAEVPSPRDPAVRSQVEATRTGLARGSALLAAGRIQEAADIGRAAVARARTLDYLPLLAEALLLDGGARQLSEPNEALASASEAARTAYTAHSDRMVVQASLVALKASVTVDRAEDAKGWRAWSEAAIRRSGSDDADEAELWNNLGLWAFKEGRFPDSLDAYERAAKLLEHRYGADAYQTRRMKRRVIALRANLCQWVSATRELEPLLAAELAQSGAQSPTAADLYQQLASQQAVLGRLAEASPNLDKAWQIIQALGGEHTYRAAIWRSYAAMLAEPRGTYLEGLAHVEAGLDLFARLAIHDSSETMELETLRGIFTTKLGRPAVAVQELERAMAAFEAAHGTARIELAPPLAALSEAYRVLRDLPRALSNAERAVHLLEGDRSLYLSDARVQLVRVLVDVGRAQPALELSERTLETLGAEAGTDAPVALAAHSLHGEALVALGRTSEGVAELEATLAIATRIGWAVDAQQAIRAALARAAAKGT